MRQASVRPSVSSLLAAGNFVNADELRLDGLLRRSAAFAVVMFVLIALLVSACGPTDQAATEPPEQPAAVAEPVPQALPPAPALRAESNASLALQGPAATNSQNFELNGVLKDLRRQPGSYAPPVRSQSGQRDVRLDVMGGRAPSPIPIPDTARFPDARPEPVHAVAEQPVSTFSVDVDTASYAVARRFLRDGRMPPREAVRVEEMVNYFRYDYPAPSDRAQPFRTTVSVFPTPWNRDTRLLHIGIRGYDVARAERPRLNLVLLIDVSGSMSPEDRLPLLRRAFARFVAELKDDDRVAIVTYANGTNVALEPTTGRERDRIAAAIERLGAGGGTAGADGLQRAYRLAERNFDREAVNRVILATDGDFNIGISDPRQLENFIAEKRKSGIYLSILGVGLDNLNDALVQRLAQAGNGNAAYIDSMIEARKVLVDELSSTMFPIANDVKIQVEFNPATVAEYRLIGYETRTLRREDFNDDRVDAGDIGAGHTVTALYEITPVESRARLIDPLRYGTPGAATTARTAGEYAHVRLRYKLPGEQASRLIETPVQIADALLSVGAAPADMQFAAAVAAFGQKLRGETRLADYAWRDIATLANSAKGSDPFGIRGELVQLIRTVDGMPVGALQP